MKTCNELGARNGVGIADMVENRLVGMKSRGVYETPAERMLYAAHRNLEEITVDRDTAHYKDQVAVKFAELVYNGLWYTPLRESLSAFVDVTQKYVTGTAKLKLYKGNCIGAGVTSPYSLYMEDIATFGDSGRRCTATRMPPASSTCYGLPLKVHGHDEGKGRFGEVSLSRRVNAGACPNPSQELSSRHLPHRFAACREAEEEIQEPQVLGRVWGKAPTFPFLHTQGGFHETLGRTL